MIKTFVLDTNCLISANLSPTSVNRQAYNIVLKIGITVYSKSTLDEFVSTLMRAKFDKYISFEKRLEAIAEFENYSQLLGTSITITACRDPKDNKFLELAVEAQASCIITGDNDLLVLHPFQNIPILTASQFLMQF